jgi:3-oxoacyl-[acyl-carrier-protein] synthase-3
MAKSVFSGIRIRGIAGAVPAQRVNNLTDHHFTPEDDRKKIVALTKVAGYRKAPAHMCASDLCQAAAEALLSGASAAHRTTSTRSFLPR